MHREGVTGLWELGHIETLTFTLAGNLVSQINLIKANMWPPALPCEVGIHSQSWICRGGWGWGVDVFFPKCSLALTLSKVDTTSLLKLILDGPFSNSHGRKDEVTHCPKHLEMWSNLRCFLNVSDMYSERTTCSPSTRASRWNSYNRGYRRGLTNVNNLDWIAIPQPVVLHIDFSFGV